MKRNEVVIDGRVLKRGALRHTPAGIPAIELAIGHRSIQREAGREREARCEIDAVAFGDLAVSIGTLKTNQPWRVSGFLAQSRVGNRKLVLHVVSADVAGGEQE